MPIPDLIDQNRIPLMGHWRLGERVKKKKISGTVEYPRELDYFRADPKDPAMINEIEKAYGTNPRRLLITFPIEPSPKEWQNWFNGLGDLSFWWVNYERYTSKRQLFCRGDGRTAKVRVEKKEEDGECGLVVETA